MIHFATILCVAGTIGGTPLISDTLPNEHELVPILRLANDCMTRIDTQIDDYTCTLVKRERIGGRLMSYEHLVMKMRHQRNQAGHVSVPQGVYLRFLGPKDLVGREVIYADGRYNNRLIARRGGQRFEYVTTTLDPGGDVAMARNRYPVTDIGMRKLVERLVEVGEEEIRLNTPVDLKYYGDVKIDDRGTTMIEFRHPVRTEQARYYIARLYIDDEYQLPVRYESYDWPKEEGEPPLLLEEYTYMNLRFNVGLGDQDFDYRNEDYGFRKDFRP